MQMPHSQEKSRINIAHMNGMETGSKIGGVSKSMLTLNEAIIDVKKG